MAFNLALLQHSFFVKMCVCDVSYQHYIFVISSYHLSDLHEGSECKMQLLFQETVEEEEQEAPVMKPEPEAEMETNSSLPLCIGPGCSKQALPDSGYCGTDCILQHAAVTMKALSGPKMPKTRGRAQRKAAISRPIVRVRNCINRN